MIAGQIALQPSHAENLKRDLLMFMKHFSVFQKLKSQSGITWIVAILMAACAVMSLIVFGEPLFVTIRDRMAVYGCAVAVDKAQKAIDIEIVQSGPSGLSLEQAQAILERNQWAMETLCPAGGECYLIEDEDAGVEKTHRYHVICGLHDEDLQRRTRANAQNVLQKLNTEVKHKRLISAGDPASIAISLNGQPLTAVQQSDELVRGTYYTSGYSGTVAFYDLDGEGISRLSFADENYCANWRRDWGWDGDAFPNEP